MVSGLLLARRALDPPQRQLRQQQHHTPTPLRRQRLPNGLGRGAAHDAIHASARLREAPRSPESATRRILSTYKRYLLWDIERAFRCIKTIDLKVRPIHHRLENRVRAHIFLCMLAYYVEWHMREAWRPLLFSDEDQAAKRDRDPVAPAERSVKAKTKAHTHALEDGTPAHSFATLMAELATVVRNTCRVPAASSSERPTFQLTTIPNPVQARAIDLIQSIKT